LKVSSSTIDRQPRFSLGFSTATIRAIDYCDECLDEIDLIPGMIAADGNDWFLVQAGATWHPSQETMADLSPFS
jgi:hypothetical protein